MSDQFDEDIFKGLNALYESSFPKECATCGRVYESADEYIQQTKSISGKSGLKSSIDDDDSTIVELFRNCVCGSTLLDCFSCRRDLSPKGLKRRQLFGDIMAALIRKGMDEKIAKSELLKVLNGGESQLIADYGVKLIRSKKNS